MTRLGRPPKDLDSFLGRKWLESIAQIIDSLISGTSGGGSINSVTNSDGSISAGTSGDTVTVSVNPSHRNVWLVSQEVPNEPYGASWDNSLEIPTKDAIYDKIETLSAPSGGGNSVTVTLPFGASFTDKAQTVVTGQTWVAADSEIVPQVLTPSGVDPDEMRLLDFKAVISDLVAGTGFTVTLYSEPEAKGDYSVMCIGV